MANHTNGTVHCNPRSQPKSSQSASSPATPPLDPHDSLSDRTPSPGSAIHSQSPRSASSDAATRTSLFKSNSSTTPSCRFQSTQTARRRMPYDSSDPLPPDPVKLAARLDLGKEKLLDENLARLYAESLPSQESQTRRDAVAAKIKRILREHFPDKEIQVSVFGSSGNLLNTDNSDVDICVTMKELDHVCTLASVLAKHDMKSVKCVHAKGVPIVKIWDPEFRMSCDLNVNNHLALVNTKLVKTYMELDERARILAMAVKYWTKCRLLNEASGGGLSSYTWTLLVINFLQTCDPPVLPGISLVDDQGRTKLAFQKDAEQFKAFGKGNQCSAGGLLFQFFRRMGYGIDFDAIVISVRSGRHLTKSEKHWDFLVNQRLCCEEPFNTVRNLGNTADEFSFHGIHLEIRQAFTRLLETGLFRERVCEHYHFPQIEAKSIFERPAPGSRPVTLTRSTSQSSRGSRHGGNRGNRMRSDPRNGGSSRRASSASTYNTDAATPFLIHPLLLQQGLPYFIPSGQVAGSQLAYERSQQQMSDQIDQLKQQQAQLALYGHNIQKLQSLDHERQYTNGSPAMQHRQFRDPRQDRSHSVAQDGFISPIIGPASYVLGAAESAPSMSYSSSYQGTSTNPPSPMLTQIPLRRNTQRASNPESPGASLRSHSQPARGYFPPILPANFPLRAAQPTAAPSAFGNIRPMQPQMYTTNPVYAPVGFMQGLPVMYPTSASPDQKDAKSQREYVGFSYAGPSVQQNLQQIPAYEDLHRKSRSHSPARKSPLINAETYGSPSAEVSSRQRLPSLPAAAKQDKKTPSPTNSGLGISGSSPAEEPGPLIVNGSMSSPNLTSLANRRAFHDTNTSSALSFRQAVQAGVEANKKNLRKSSVGSDAPAGPLPSVIGQEKQAWKSPRALFATDDVYVKKEEVAPNRTPVRGSEDAARRISQGSRSNVPPLDLGAPTERQPFSTLAATLSPVREQATPSPTESRRMSANPIMNGHKSLPSYGHALRNSISGPPPSASRSPKAAESPPSGNKPTIPAPSFAVPVRSNEWQQAPSRKNGKKKTSQNGKSTGQAMPTNASDRKGG